MTQLNMKSLSAAIIAAAALTACGETIIIDNAATSSPTPTNAATVEPTAEVTQAPTANPTANPTSNPTANPTNNPTNAVTVEPTAEATQAPTANPTNNPTNNPTIAPTSEPTDVVTNVCDGVTQWSGSESWGNYSQGTERQHNGNLYELTGEAAWGSQAEPGTNHHSQPWTLVSSCASTSGPTATPTTAPSVSASVNPSTSTSTVPSTTATASATPTTAPTTAPTATATSTPIVDELCADYNVYPNWTQTTYANQGDIMVYDNIAYSAKYYTTSIPGSDDTWVHFLNCDGTEIGAPALLSMPNPKDPVSLKVAGWPSYIVAAMPSSSYPSTQIVNTAYVSDLSNTANLTSAFEALINAAKSAGSASVVLSGNVLNSAVADKGASLGAIPVKQALTAAVAATNASQISTNDINELSDDAKGWAKAHNLIMTHVAPNATFGWELSIGTFAHDYHSGYRSVWNAASKSTASMLDSFALYKGSDSADFVAFSKSTSTATLTADQWDNALRFVKQVTDFVDSPALLSSIPTSQAGEYFLGATSKERKLRHAAYHNVFAVLFDADSSTLSSKINDYMNATIPLYFVADGSSNTTAITRIESLNNSLYAAENGMNNQAFLYETPSNGWEPSTIYKWNDFLTGLNSMHNVGVSGEKFWLIDDNADDATNAKYAKVAIAAFLAQSMQETIRYNACDENNWAQVKYGAPADYPMSASCGQLGQKYADYGTNPTSGLDHAYSCPRNTKMEVTASTHAKWYGAPAPIFAAPDSVLSEANLLVNGNVGRWDHSGVWCADNPTLIDDTKQAWERDECKVYVGQKAGGFVWDGSSGQSVEGCGWWGRGVIQTTGRQNFGTLNHFIGRSHVDPATVGTTIDGQLVADAPENPLYANLDLCSSPQLICSTEEHAEIKWIAGLFFWMTSVQGYNDVGGPYADWNYFTELKAYVDGGMVGTGFIDAVSGIVNRGCPDDHCPVSGEVHAIEERRANFVTVLEQLGLDPQ